MGYSKFFFKKREELKGGFNKLWKLQDKLSNFEAVLLLY